MRRRTVPGQLLRLLQLLILPVLYLIIKAAENSPTVVEDFYSMKLYPVIRGAVSAFTRIFPFSLVEISAYILAVVLVVVFLVRFFRLIFLRKEASVQFLSFIISLVLAGAYFLFTFYVMWGLNYYREPLSVRLDLPERQYTEEELYEVCLDLAEHAKAERENVLVDTSGIFCGTFNDMKKDVVEAYTVFGATRPSFKANVPQVKPIWASEFFSKCGISGIYIFLTEEANINVNEPFLYQPFSAAHETGHFMGYASEEDASFLAFIVCRDAKSSSVKYSGYMHALTNCGNALAAANRELYDQLRSVYSDGMNADLAFYSEYYNRYADTEVWNKSNDLNDSYLKANNQEKGVLSYKEDVALILRFYDSIGFFS